MKFDIPKSFWLYGNKITVDWQTDLVANEDFVGKAIPIQNRISLQPPIGKLIRDENGLKQTFIHELVHCILSVMNDEELSRNEIFVDMFSQLLWQFIITSETDNDEFMIPNCFSLFGHKINVFKNDVDFNENLLCDVNIHANTIELSIPAGLENLSLIAQTFFLMLIKTILIYMKEDDLAEDEYFMNAFSQLFLQFLITSENDAEYKRITEEGMHIITPSELDKLKLKMK